jgi:hypothetical protein
MDNRRTHPRTPMKVRVKILNSSVGEKIVVTRNISDGGLFLVAEPTEMPNIGEVVEAQVQGILENPPIVRARIVRLESDGVGLQFVSEV